MSREKFTNRVGKASSSLLFSITIHLAILFIISLLGDNKKLINEPPLVIHTMPEPPEEKEVTTPPIIRDELVPKVVEIQPTEPKPPTEKNLTIDVPIAEVNDVESDKLDPIFNLPNVEAASEIPTIAILSHGGIPGGGGSGIPGRRTSSTKDKIKMTDTDLTSIQSVEAALKWLALHQELDGSWDATKYEGTDNGERTAETAIALLAFLGYGQSEVGGQYKDNLRRGFRYLNSVVDQHRKDKKDLLFGRTYGSALVLMALSESTMFSNNPLTKKNAGALAEYLIQAHGDSDAGWNYRGAGDDFSVSGWVALALKSARMAELPIMKDKLYLNTALNYKTWVHENMSNPETGLALYRQNGKNGSRNMSLVAMVVKSFMHYDQKDPFMKKAAEHGEVWTQELLGSTPKDAYGIYYGSLAAFLSNGPFWKTWNDHMKVCLVKAQCQGDPKELGGSWNPTPSHTGKMGGRVMDTALFVLSLEACYRFDRTGG